MSDYYDGPRIFDDRDYGITINIYQGPKPDEEAVTDVVFKKEEKSFRRPEANIAFAAEQAGVASDPCYRRLRPERQRRLVEVTTDIAAKLHAKTPEVTPRQVRRHVRARLRQEAPRVGAVPWLLIASIVLRIASWALYRLRS